jgi:uncharacterized membrane-anchored protein YhcB (DUF1043 family)
VTGAKWLLAGLLFALSVAMAIGTVAVRAENARLRHAVERELCEIEDRIVELRRLTVARLEAASPEQLAAVHWAHLVAAAQRRAGDVQ